jgi:hypothetical protein
MSYFCLGPGERSRYSDSLRPGGYWGRVLVGGEIFRTRPDWPTQPPVRWVPALFSGSKAAGAWRLPLTSAEIKRTVSMPPTHFCAVLAGYRVSFTFVVFMIWRTPGCSAFGAEFCGTRGQFFRIHKSGTNGDPKSLPNCNETRYAELH